MWGIFGFKIIKIIAGVKLMNSKTIWHPSMNLKDVFINVKNKIYLWFLNRYVAKEDEYYSFIEPSAEWMTLHNKKIWIQPCNKSNENNEEVIK